MPWKSFAGSQTNGQCVRQQRVLRQASFACRLWSSRFSSRQFTRQCTTIIDAKASYTMVRSYQSREHLRNDALRKASSSETGVGDIFCSAFVRRTELVSSLSAFSCASDFAMEHVVSPWQKSAQEKKSKGQSNPEKVGCHLGGTPC